MEMIPLRRITSWRTQKRDSAFAKGYEEGYEQFKIGVTAGEARGAAGQTQDELAMRLRTKKTAISRIENHAEDDKVIHLERFAAALGKSSPSAFLLRMRTGVWKQGDYKSGRVKRRKK